MSKWAKLTPEQIALLGTGTDREVAQKSGLSLSKVVYARRNRNIPRVPECRKWQPKDLSALGVIPDAVLAKEYGVSTITVTTRRKELNIASPPRQGAWTASELTLLGTMPDKDVAQAVGRTARAVAKQRVQKGITPFRHPEVDHTRGKIPYEEPPAQVPAEIAKQLGTASDAQVAARLELSQPQVRRLRKKLGVAAHMAMKRWTPAEVAMLGTATDKAIAKRLGRTRASVLYARTDRGIAAYKG